MLRIEQSRRRREDKSNKWKGRTRVSSSHYSRKAAGAGAAAAPAPYERKQRLETVECYYEAEHNHICRTPLLQFGRKEGKEDHFVAESMRLTKHMSVTIRQLRLQASVYTTDALPLRATRQCNSYANDVEAMHLNFACRCLYVTRCVWMHVQMQRQPHIYNPYQ